MTIYEFVRKRRKELGLSQVQLAERAGCSVSVIKRMEAAKPYNPNIRYVGKIAKALEVSPELLIMECEW